MYKDRIQEKTFNDGIWQNIENYPDCIDKGVLMNFYDSSKGLPNGLSNNCEIIEQLPSSYDKPEFLSTECLLSVKFQILDLNNFNSCISEESCILINGVDVQIEN